MLKQKPFGSIVVVLQSNVGKRMNITRSLLSGDPGAIGSWGKQVNHKAAGS